MAESLVEEKLGQCWLYGYPLLLLFIIGAGKILNYLFDLISPFILPRLNLQKRYGGGWALVTGGSEGIGFAIAEELAKEGFNIVLISRNKGKLEDARGNILKVKSGIQVEIKSVDFEALVTEEDYRSAFAEQLKKDIGILVNNVGSYHPKYFSTLSFGELRSELKLNLFPITMMSRLFIEKMKERPTKSGIINLSSGGAMVSYRGIAHYTSTKKYDDNLSLALADEYGHNIDFQTARPYMVTTRLTNFTDSFLHTSARSSAKQLVNSLGRKSISYGTFFHTLQGLGTAYFHNRLTSPVYSSAVVDFKNMYNNVAK